MIPEASLNRIARVEISLRELQAKGAVTIPLSGNCMWPVVRDGDLVSIQKTEYRRLKFGDVAVFQTTPETFHANTQFRNLKPEERDSPPANYVGKITRLTRNHKTLDLDLRSWGTRLLQVLVSPANPYGLSLPKTLLRKIRK